MSYETENRLKRNASLGNYNRFSVRVLREVRENGCSQRLFSLLMEKPNFKNSWSILYCFRHAKFLFILQLSTVLCRTVRGLPFYCQNADLTCETCGNLCLAYKCNIYANTLPNTNLVFCLFCKIQFFERFLLYCFCFSR